MITNIQVRKLKKYLSQGKTLEVASAKSGMDEKSGRKYRNLDKLPSEIRAERKRWWRTHEDPFETIWAKARSFLEINEGLEAKTLFKQRRLEVCPVQFRFDHSPKTSPKWSILSGSNINEYCGNIF